MTLKLHCDQCDKTFEVKVLAQWHGSEPDPIGQIVLDQHKRYDCDKRDAGLADVKKIPTDPT
jgi:hypothetical protein